MDACEQVDILCKLQPVFGYVWQLLRDLWPAVVEGLEYVKLLFRWFGDQLQAIASLAAFSFGLWKWWSNREEKIIERFGEILSTKDTRLRSARADLVEIMRTPGPGRRIEEPVFAVDQLRRVLSRRDWLPVVSARRLPTKTDRSLSIARSKLEQLTKRGIENLRSKREEQFTALMLQGSIEAARADRNKNLAEQTATNNSARDYFEQALRVESFQNDPLARECVGLQWLKLEDWDRADEIFSDMQFNAPGDLDPIKRTLFVARAQFFRAQVAIGRGQQVGGAGLNNANNYLVLATGIMDPLGPFSEARDQLQHARTHELHACVRRHLGYANHQTSLSRAETCYQQLKSTIENMSRLPSTHSLLISGSRRRSGSLSELTFETKAALDRIARMRSGQINCVCGRNVT
jgi:hypothetical protein